MFGRQASSGAPQPFDEDILDEIEGEALIVAENPDRYAVITVEMARRTLAMVARLRRRADDRPERQTQPA